MALGSPSVAIITMARWGDFPHAWSCLNPLQALLASSVHHFILLNDSRDPGGEQTLAQRPHTTLITPGRNLGVAGGRNRLIEAAMDWGAELIVSLDDDLLVPIDYVERLIAQIEALSADGHQVGIVGAAVLDYHESRLHDDHEQQLVEAGELETYLDTDEVRRVLVDAWGNDLPADVVYHMGIRDWRDHYMRPSGPRAALLRSVARSLMGTGNSGHVPSGEVRRTDLRSDVLRQGALPISVDTVAGGVCAYTADLVRDIGLLEEAFSPFGYEDAEYAIRARTRGYENFVLPSEILLHDLASRNKARDAGVVLVGLGKARALIARKQSEDGQLPVWLAESLVNGLMQVAFAIESRSDRGQASPADLLDGSLRYLAGYLAGAFRPLTSSVVTEPVSWEGVHLSHELQVRSGRIRFDRITCRAADFDADYAADVPIALDVDLEGVEVGIGGAGPLSGLPRTVKGSVGITYEMDIGRRRFELSRLVVDLPGLLQLDLSAALVGVGPGEPRPEIDVDGVGVEYVAARLRDRGVVSRVESTVAWAQGLIGDGVLPALAPQGDSAIADSLRDWLAGAGGDLVLSLHPETPVTIADLKSNDAPNGAVRSLQSEFSPTSELPVHS